MDDILKDLPLTSRHFETFEATLKDLIDKPWSYRNPVFLLDRCWLRLEKIRLDELTYRLPPDNSGEAPELIKYNQLLEKGYSHLLAVQECWSEFGMEDFHRAMKNNWYWEDIGNHGWTYKGYIELVHQYRQSFIDSSVSIPIVVLCRKGSLEHHEIEWIQRRTLNKLIPTFSKSL